MPAAARSCDKLRAGHPALRFYVHYNLRQPATAADHPPPPTPAPPPTPPHLQTYVPVNEYVTNYFGFKHSFQWATVGVLIGFVFFFRCLALLAMTRMNFQNR